MTIIVIGGSGLLGSVLMPAVRSLGGDVFSMGRSEVNDLICDLTNLKELHASLEKYQPDVIINLVALTDVELCELKPTLAFSLNVRTVENIVSWIKKDNNKCHLVHLSTDQVYDGNGPHSEADVTLSNYYAFSKYAADLVALQVGATILRTNFFGKSMCEGRLSFTDWIYRAIINKEKMQLFNDVFFSPLSMRTLAEMILVVISIRPYGVFNLGSHIGLSKSDFAFLFMKKLNMYPGKVEIMSIHDVDFVKTYRPKDMRLKVTKFEQNLSLSLPKLEDEIDKVIGDYDAKS